MCNFYENCFKNCRSKKSHIAHYAHIGKYLSTKKINTTSKIRINYSVLIVSDIVYDLITELF